MTLGSKNKISPLATPRTYKGECGNCRAGTDTLGLCGCAGVTGASLKLSYSPFVSETRSHVIGQAGLQVNPPASAHPVLGLQGVYHYAQLHLLSKVKTIGPRCAPILLPWLPPVGTTVVRHCAFPFIGTKC